MYKSFKLCNAGVLQNSEVSAINLAQAPDRRSEQSIAKQAFDLLTFIQKPRGPGFLSPSQSSYS
jgi:hypothetical protein